MSTTLLHNAPHAAGPSGATTASATATAHAEQPGFALAPPHAANTMGITKRDGRREPVDVGKIVRAVQRCCDGLDDIDPMRVALKTIAGIYDGATTRTNGEPAWLKV